MNNAPETHKPARIIAFVNQKGGVGKSTITLNLGAALARTGLRVLICDLDAQANTTGTLLPKDANGAPMEGVVEYTMADLWRLDPKTQFVVKGCGFNGIIPTDDAWPESLDMIPGSIEMSTRRDDRGVGAEQRLRSVMEGVDEDYDFILIDCPPSLDLLTVNALTYADEAVIVSSPAYWGLEGVSMIRDTINRVKSFYNPSLTINSLVMNMADLNLLEDRARFHEAQDNHGDILYSKPMRRSTVIESANGAGCPVYEMGPKGQEHFTWVEEFVNEKFGVKS